MHLKIILAIACWLQVSIYALVTVENRHNALQLTTLYGTTLIAEPVLITLIKSPAFERLQHINQYGAVHYVEGQKKFTRYEHSLGVFFLTKKFGAPLDEQIAALLHDVSHTVFSHVGDVLFKSNYRSGKDSYQDTIHEWYLKQSGIANILQSYGYEHACSAAAKQRQRCFEQSLPNLCADRIEYNLSGGFLDGLITADEIHNLLNALHFQEESWFFDSQAMAEKFGRLSLELSESRWGSAWGVFVDYIASLALQRAIDLAIITYHDIHFSTDEVIWQRLNVSQDSTILSYLDAIEKCTTRYVLASSGAEDIHLRGKFSGTDPFVAHNGKLVRLRELSESYPTEFARVKNLVATGWHITFINAKTIPSIAYWHL